MPKSIHIICDFKYEEYKDVEKVMDSSIDEVGELSVVNKFKHNFEPFGLSLIYVLSESHISIHTWEEYNYISCDMYTCGEKSPKNTLDCFLSKFDVIELNEQIIKRGL